MIINLFTCPIAHKRSGRTSSLIQPSEQFKKLSKISDWLKKSRPIKKIHFVYFSYRTGTAQNLLSFGIRWYCCLKAKNHFLSLSAKS